MWHRLKVQETNMYGCTVRVYGEDKVVVVEIMMMHHPFSVLQMKLAFTLDRESGMPQGCYIYQYRDSNK